MSFISATTRPMFILVVMIGFALSTQPTWGAERDYLIVIREIQGDGKSNGLDKEEEVATSSKSSVRRVLETRAENGKPFYARSSDEGSQIVFTGKLTTLPEGRVRIDYTLNQSIMGEDPPEALRIEGRLETERGNTDDPPILKDSISPVDPEGESTYWELEVHYFFEHLGFRDYPSTPLCLRLMDEEGAPVQGATLTYALTYVISRTYGSTADAEDILAYDRTPSDEEGRLEIIPRYLLPLITIVVVHEERDLIGATNMERHLQASRSDPYVITMKRRQSDDTTTE